MHANPFQLQNGGMRGTLQNLQVNPIVASLRIATQVFARREPPSTTTTVSSGTGSGDTVQWAEPQVAHGFSANDVVSHNGTIYVKADRDDPTLTAIGFVGAVADADNFTLVQSGKLTMSGLTPGYYWLDSTAGAMTSTVPSSGIKQCLGIAVSATEFLVAIGEPFDTASSVAYTGRYVDGAAFPGSPTTHWKMYRTDIDLDCFYDGTRWLTIQEYPMTLQSGPTSVALAATGVVGYGPVESAYSVYFHRCLLTTYVSGTSNGTNGWTVEVKKVNPANAATQFSGGSVSTHTAPDTTVTWTKHDLALTEVVAAGSYPTIQVTATKVLSPGALYCLPELFYRRIVT